jgi:hypothetical protein
VPRSRRFSAAVSGKKCGVDERKTSGLQEAGRPHINVAASAFVLESEHVAELVRDDVARDVLVRQRRHAGRADCDECRRMLARRHRERRELAAREHDDDVGIDRAHRRRQADAGHVHRHAHPLQLVFVDVGVRKRDRAEERCGVLRAQLAVPERNRLAHIRDALVVPVANDRDAQRRRIRDRRDEQRRQHSERNARHARCRFTSRATRRTRRRHRCNAYEIFRKIERSCRTRSFDAVMRRSSP